MSHPKPWFGSKRIGFGIRPQTWQGWLIMAGIAVVILLIVTLVHH